MKVVYILSFLFYINCVASENNLILISLDGFSHNFLNKYKLPHLQHLLETGVNASYGSLPSFPRNTLSSHRTLVTGLYPESHGILGDQMYDPLFKKHFSFNSISKFKYYTDKWWQDSEPIWDTAVRSGINVGISFWPGGYIDLDISMTGEPRAFIDSHDGKQDFKSRVDTVVGWLGAANVRFALMYFEEPYDTAMAYGPDSPQLGKTVKRMDNVVGYLVDSLKKAKLFEHTNLIVTSGHAVHSLRPKDQNVLVLSEHLDEKNLQFVPLIPDRSAVVGLWPKEGKEDKVFVALYQKHPYVHIDRKEAILFNGFLHFQNNRRIMPIVAFAQEGYFISYNRSGYDNKTVVGMDGYGDPYTYPRSKTQKALFLASGPNFRRGRQLSPLKDVDIYTAMCHLLGITLNPNNGTLNEFKWVLKSTSIVTKPSYFLVIALSLSSFYVALINLHNI